MGSLLDLETYDLLPRPKMRSQIYLQWPTRSATWRIW